MKLKNCEACIFRARPWSENSCDYASLTGRTRMAQPAGKGCTYRVTGDRGKLRLVGDTKEPSKPKPPKRAGWRRLDPAQAMALYEKKWSDGDIAKELRVSCNAVLAWRGRNSLPPNFKHGQKKSSKKD